MGTCTTLTLTTSPRLPISAVYPRQHTQEEIGRNRQGTAGMPGSYHRAPDRGWPTSPKRLSSLKRTTREGAEEHSRHSSNGLEPPHPRKDPATTTSRALMRLGIRAGALQARDTRSPARPGPSPRATPQAACPMQFTSGRKFRGRWRWRTPCTREVPAKERETLPPNVAQIAPGMLVQRKPTAVDRDVESTSDAELPRSEQETAPAAGLAPLRPECPAPRDLNVADEELNSRRPQYRSCRSLHHLPHHRVNHTVDNTL